MAIIRFQLFQLISYLVVIFDSLLMVASADPACYRTISYKCPAEDFEIRYPFFVGLRSENYDFIEPASKNSSTLPCGYKGFEIKCREEDGRAVINISNHLYLVLNIQYFTSEYHKYGNYYFQPTIEVVDVDVEGQDCPQPKQTISFESATSLFVKDDSYNWTLFYNCSSHPQFTDSYKCLNDKNSNPRRSYAVPYQLIEKNSEHGNCEQTVVAQSISQVDYSGTAKSGFKLSWYQPINCTECERSYGICYYDDTTGYQCYSYHGILESLALMPNRLKLIVSIPSGVMGLFLISLYFYWRIFCSLHYSTIYRLKNKPKTSIDVEVLLESYGCNALQRYKYSDIKMMTYSFKDEIGKGGYGSVFKGTRGDDGRVVAVKVLKESKGNGEDFINEVVTIGRTNHVNVVSLLGFCNEGKKRALVYEFMQNGSLEKFIYNEKTSNTQGTYHLGWDKLYHITVGIARGLEYLHCRCNTRILHFDIKPHNILLDHDFSPKISDFGLAKLCPTRESVVSMIGTRGTWGYTAPEICCRNLGGVSHKSDVYSYGMMVLEMIGGRKNLDVNVENISGIYFPHWIYNQLKVDYNKEGNQVIKVEGSEEIFKNETVKKMIVIALWCIQTHPANRPSMTKVVEMLEASNEECQMPPNPSLDPASTSLPSL